MGALLAKGQLSYLILSCLEEKDMYGLELIDEIKKRSGVDVKMPSLYSNLNRMKELKYISTYLKESNKGPKCAYSSITENGRNELNNLKRQFGNDSFAARIQDKKVVTESVNDLNKNNPSIDKDKFEDYDDFFASIPTENDKSVNAEKNVVFNKNEKDDKLDKPDKPQLLKEIDELYELKKKEQVESYQDQLLENEISSGLEKIDLEDDSKEKNIKSEKINDDAVFLTDEDNDLLSSTPQLSQNTFDISNDYNKYKRKRSFSQNQIEMDVTSVLPAVDEKNERKNENIGSLREALLQSKQGNYDEIHLNKIENVEVKNNNEKNTDKNHEEKDDGIFITDRVNYVPKFRRFDPPRLNILNKDKDSLPAPKRNIQLDPNCADVRAKIENLYSLSKNEEVENSDDALIKGNDFNNFDDLKDYYESQNISFRQYRRSDNKKAHNTNKIIFFVDLIIFGLISLGSIGLFFILQKLNLTKADTNFVFYLFPILYFVYLMVRLYFYKKVKSKVPKPLFKFIAIFGISILLLGGIFALNLLTGIPLNEFLLNSTTLFVPSYFVICILFFRHYILLFSLKKFWK